MPPPGRANARAADPGGAVAFDNNGGKTHSPARLSRQTLPPLERYEPYLPDDKLALFEVRVPAWLLRRLVEHFRRAPVREVRP
jgi:hypothetical protein